MKPLTEHIRRWHEQSDRKPGDDAGAIHPSSLGDCNRRTIYKYKGVPRDLEFNEFKQKIFFHGYAIEFMMNKALEDQGLLIAKNVPVKAMYDGIPVEGTIDQIVRWPLEEPNGWCIADTKSVSDHAFKYKSFPYEHHVLQVGTYQWALGQCIDALWDQIPYNGNLTEADNLLAGIGGGAYGLPYPPLLFYVGRGNLKELEPVTAGDNAMYLALEKLDEIAWDIKTDALPVRPFRTPEEHPYLCASRVRKGHRRSDGTYTPGNEPLYKPNCEWFKTCWKVMPDEWSFWYEVAGREELAF